MALKAVLQSLDGIDESLKAHYAKGEDGRFYAVVEGIDDMPAVAGLKRKNSELLDEKKQVEKKLEALGVSTPEEVEQLRTAAKQNNSDKVKELETKLSQVSEASQKEILKAQDEAKAERDAARSYFESGEITRAISAAKGVPELLAHVVRGHIETARGDDGSFSLKVKGKDGQPRIKDSQGNAFTLDDLVAELRADPKFGRAFEGEGKGGSGANPGGGTGGGSGKTIAWGDTEAFGANLEQIAKGEVQVAGPA